MRAYIHKVQYYETDRMGITHHSNYVRWMEEARMDFFEQLDWDYLKFEEDGMISPVIGVDCKYRETTTAGEIVSIDVRLVKLSGARFQFQYQMNNEQGQVVFTGHTEHCFLDPEGKPVRLKKQFPEFYQTMEQLLQEG
jgi:acyl-CoA thioester hydrolase